MPQKVYRCDIFTLGYEHRKYTCVCAYRRELDPGGCRRPEDRVSAQLRNGSLKNYSRTEADSYPREETDSLHSAVLSLNGFHETNRPCASFSQVSPSPFEPFYCFVGTTCVMMSIIVYWGPSPSSNVGRALRRRSVITSCTVKTRWFS